MAHSMAPVYNLIEKDKKIGSLRFVMNQLNMSSEPRFWTTTKTSSPMHWSWIDNIAGRCMRQRQAHSWFNVTWHPVCCSIYIIKWEKASLAVEYRQLTLNQSQIPLRNCQTAYLSSSSNIEHDFWYAVGQMWDKWDFIIIYAREPISIEILTCIYWLPLRHVPLLSRHNKQVESPWLSLKKKNQEAVKRTKNAETFYSICLYSNLIF